MAAEIQPCNELTAFNSAAVTAVAAQAQAPSQEEFPPAPENAGPPPAAPKRQRRPSVRLGEIGENQPATAAHEPLVRRSKWRLPKDAPNRKARSLTHLVNGNDNGNGNGDSDLDPAQRKPKVKRELGIGTAAKRVRSGWNPKAEETAEQNLRARDWEVEVDEEVEEEEEERDRRGRSSAYRDFRRSPDLSADDNMAVPDSWHWRGNQAPESERRDEGVRSWLMELGLSRYMPIFEVHEVDDEVLPTLTFEDLKDMGIHAVGSRRKMYSSILKLRKEFSDHVLC
ncbi:hypothetical protein SAY86_008904 [Trapa natans]|uniref:SAM domain-containing protein n=1 Tax=Trapa natans TaxID=22666 RepID=A0AAN7KAA9_TRANT|nr:hypothetical protein SAY86_008904 [Trapa natans]